LLVTPPHRTRSVALRSCCWTSAHGKWFSSCRSAKINGRQLVCLPCVHIAVHLSQGSGSVHAEVPKSMGDSWSVCCPYLTDSVLLSQCKEVVTERACDHTLYNQWQGPRKGSSDDERRRAQGSSQALRKKRATPGGNDDPSAGKVLQSSLAMHPGEDNICYMFKKPRSWGKKLGLAMSSAPNTELPS